MSKARFGIDDPKHQALSHALKLLKEAQAIVDTLDRPHIGARLQEVIEALRALPQD